MQGKMRPRIAQKDIPIQIKKKKKKTGKSWLNRLALITNGKRKTTKEKQEQSWLKIIENIAIANN